MEWWRIAVVVLAGVLAWVTLREVFYARGGGLLIGLEDCPSEGDTEDSR